MDEAPATDLLERELEAYEAGAGSELAGVADRGALEEWHRTHLGRSGAVGGFRKRIGGFPAEDRPAVGKLVGAVATRLEEAYAAAGERVSAADPARLVDVTEPPRRRRRGSVHPVTAMLDEMIGIFAQMGFSVFEGPHVELDELNFGLLNMPPHHPARDMQDTFYVRSGPADCESGDDELGDGELTDVVMRTHTSPGQIRAMRAFAPAPLRVVIPGRCYRNEDVTPRSEMQFHQVEGLMVGPDVRLSDLKGILLAFARHAFGTDQEVRVRASYFPFTEPSVEIDIRCTLCGGSGCRVCKQTGWLEMLGGGLVHPVVLRNGGYDPAAVRGIAWGLGVERPLLLRHQIGDIRNFFRNDLRFLAQFR